ncbi:uracil permease [Trichomonascus vanleenenianus]|uniref:nucleobase cation symporter-1 family protein n=1 Tax=Trichomonascus vanleenenianus TaxID=2268995 RepID=UPI003ECB0021
MNDTVRTIWHKIQTNHDPNLSGKELFLQNDDLKPVTKDKRLWGGLNFTAFWIADAFNVNTWQIASAGIIAGLTWWQVWLTVWIGYLISGLFVALIGRVGAKYHITYSVAVRSSFGIFGSYWPIINRVVMACIWFGVQAWLGGQCVQLMLRAIWLDAPNMHNGIPGSGTTSFEFLSFFVWWVAVLPLIWFPVHQIRHLFTIKSYLVPIAGVGFLVWTIKKAGGLGPVVHQPAKIHGSDFVWEFIKGIMNCVANFAALIMNNSDFSRFSKKPSSAILPQIFAIPISFALTSLIGILVSSASTVIYKETIWSPLVVLDNFLDGSPSSGTRAGVFFIAAVFAVAQAGNNLAANSISAGTDMTALFPRFINIRRGGYICALIGFAMCPWKLLSSSSQFTTYLSSYTVFLSSIAGIIFSDYYLVRKGKIIVEDLYSLAPNSSYIYWYGFSWRAFTAYFCGLLINIVGFAGSVGADVPIGSEYVFNLNYFGGFIVSSSVYYLICLWKPVPNCNTKFNEDQAAFYDAQEVIEGVEVKEDNASSIASKDDDFAIPNPDNWFNRLRNKI